MNIISKIKEIKLKNQIKLGLLLMLGLNIIVSIHLFNTARVFAVNTTTLYLSIAVTIIAAVVSFILIKKIGNKLTNKVEVIKNARDDIEHTVDETSNTAYTIVNDSKNLQEQIDQIFFKVKDINQANSKNND